MKYYILIIILCLCGCQINVGEQTPPYVIGETVLDDTTKQTGTLLELYNEPNNRNRLYAKIKFKVIKENGEETTKIIAIDAYYMHHYKAEQK